MYEIYYKIDPREERLPKWAQDQLKGMRASMRSMQRALEQDVSDANTFLRANHPIPDEALGKDVRVLFKLGARGWRDDYTVNIEGGFLHVSAPSTLMVVATASNRIQIKSYE